MSGIEDKRMHLVAATSLVGELASAYSAACATCQNISENDRKVQANRLFEKLMKVADFVIEAMER